MSIADHTIIETLERRRVSAMLTADVSTLEELLHPELLFGHTNGHAEDKTSYLKKFKDGAVRYFDADHEISTIRVIRDIALVNFRLKMRAGLGAVSRELNVVGLTVWISDAGSWRMVGHNPTVVDS